ncbi:MAG: hypothetical protein JW876_02580 [Candidatus Krumholzibacteriota bacterium]|nr:hypothetical protein [Candidatus Krumholzibacteriota bacterium]
MNETKERLRRLEAALFAAARRRPVPEPPAAWSARVMRDIRRIGPLAAPNNSAPFGRLAWRFAAAACLAALVLFVLAARGGLIPYGEIARILLEDPTGTVFGEPLVI